NEKWLVGRSRFVPGSGHPRNDSGLADPGPIVTLVSVWLHLLGVVAWIGGLAYQAHVLGPAARRGDAGVFAEAARRGRPVAWTAVAVVALTGFYNVTRLGPLERVMASGAGLLLAGKFVLVLGAVALAAQRDFALVPRLGRALVKG